MMTKIKYEIEIWIAVCVIGAFVCTSCSGGGGGGGGGGGNGGGNHTHNTPPHNNAPALVFGWANTVITFHINPSDTDTPAQTLTCEVVSNSCPGGALNDCVWSWTPSEAQAPTSCEVVTRVFDGKDYSSEVATKVKVYGDADINTCYILDADFLVPGNSVSLTQPQDGECTYFYRPGMSLTDSKNSVDMGMNWTIDASRLIATLKVTNKTGNTLQRVWLTTHAVMGGSDEIYPASDGYIGDGVYYFLRNLDPGESVSVEVAYDITPGAVFFRSILDVVTVADRIGFDYITANNTEEVWSAPKDGGTDFPVYQPEPGIYAIYPTFSQDGGWTAFTWGTPPEAEVWIARMDGGGGFPLTCYGGTAFTVPGDFTPDGKKLVVRHGEDYMGGDIHNYLLDIAAAMADCSDRAAMAQLSTSYSGKNEILASAAPDGSFILYGRLEMDPAFNRVEPPYPCLDPATSCKNTPNPTCCPNWTFGSEATYGVTKLYLLPTDPVSGLATGPEKLFWDGDALISGLEFVTPDSSGVVLKAGGCLKYKYYCNTSTCQWYINCKGISPPYGLYTMRIDYINGTAAFHVGSTLKAGTGTIGTIVYESGTSTSGSLWVGNIVNSIGYDGANLTENPVGGSAKQYGSMAFTNGLFKLQIPSDWSVLPYTYNDTSKYTQYYGFVTLLDPFPDNPFWCWQSDRVVFRDSANNVSDCKPTNCASDRNLLVDLSGNIYSPKCTQAVGGP